MASPSSSAAELRLAAQSSYDQAIDQLAGGDFNAAVAGFRAALALDPDYTDAAHGLMHALKAAGQLGEAIALAQALIAANPDDTLAHTSLSILYQHQGKVPEAEAAALRAKLSGWKQLLREQPVDEGGR